MNMFYAQIIITRIILCRLSNYAHRLT